MFRNDIAVIRAVQSDRIRDDVMARVQLEVGRRESASLAARRAIGRSLVRVGSRLASEAATEASLDLARSR